MHYVAVLYFVLCCLHYTHTNQLFQNRITLLMTYELARVYHVPSDF